MILKTTFSSLHKLKDLSPPFREHRICYLYLAFPVTKACPKKGQRDPNDDLRPPNCIQSQTRTDQIRRDNKES